MVNLDVVVGPADILFGTGLWAIALAVGAVILVTIILIIIKNRRK